MTKITPIPCGMVNCYLLKSGERGILVDAGMPKDAGRIESALMRENMPPKNLSMLIITHAHADHIGAAEHFRKEHGVSIAMHRVEAETPPRFADLKPLGFFGHCILLFSRMGERFLTPDIRLDAEFSLADAGFPGLSIAHTPGHTKGSICLRTENGDLIAGDTFFNMPRPRSAVIAEDPEELRRSMAALQGMGIRTIYPGHGRPFAFEKIAATI